jgi:uncharacterized protein YkwD
MPTPFGPTSTRPASLPPDIGAVGLDAEEQAFLKAINDQRTALGLRALVPHPELMASAQWHANDEATYGYLSHWDSLGRDSGTRMRAYGASPYAWMCNISLGGSEGGWEAWNVFYHSPGHNGCMIDPKYSHIGIGRSWASFQPGDGWRWSIDLSQDADLYQ